MGPIRNVPECTYDQNHLIGLSGFFLAIPIPLCIYVQQVSLKALLCVYGGGIKFSNTESLSSFSLNA